MPDDNDLASLKRQRATIKSSCTRIKTYVDAIRTVNLSQLAQIEESKIKLDKYWADYDGIQTQLEALDDAEAPDRATFEDIFYSLAAKMRELLTIMPPAVSVGTALSVGPSTSTARESSRPLTHVRLPKLNLPSFSGKYDEWFPFRDTFVSVIHSNTELSNIQRLQYLRASLTGDAGKVVDSLEISDVNYEVAWTLLKERYDNKRVIVQSHIKALIELPSMAKENHVELRKIADGAARHLHALQALKRPTDKWDDLLIHVLSSKLDAVTLREWQSSLVGNELPTQKQFFDFITRQCQMLEATGKSSAAAAKTSSARLQSCVKKQSCATTIKKKCHFCQGEHSVYYCRDFLALATKRRIAEIRDRKLCSNCLRSSSHASSECISGGCRICQAKHNTLLHVSNAFPGSSGRNAGDTETSKLSNLMVAQLTTASSVLRSGQSLLSTAVVYVYDSQGSLRPGRALLDSGSQANLISKKYLTSLGLTSHPLNVSLSGVNGTASTTAQVVEVKLQSRLTSYNASIECVVADRVTDPLPASSLKQNAIDVPRNIKLADPRFYASTDIDILIRVDIFWELLCVGQIKIPDRRLTLQKTQLGWVIGGPVSNSLASASRVNSFHTSITNVELHAQLGRLWQLEDRSDSPDNYTLEERYCERHFLNNVTQTPQGRYVVKLPVKEQIISRLGDSRSVAFKRLMGIERRFKRNPDLKAQYSQFMREYLSLAHMRRVEPQHIETPVSFYLPHHCVHKISSESSKLCVVFDASCKGSSNVSLNNAFMIGPVVQQDLMSILLRFRTFRYAITADIIKMYRQILIDPSQTSLQRILWREDPDDEIGTYELMTITYGTASASYLATRCLSHLADQFAAEYPIGSIHVKCDFYMDDLLAGADTVREVDTACNFVSKRTILSEAARLFDPLGLLGPVTITARLILQELWLVGTHWDESVPQGIHTRWADLKTQLVELNDLRVPRCVKLRSEHQLLQIHGVAPLKTISLPRLELSAVLLPLARLIVKIKEAINLANVATFLWTDSTTTLNWITSTSRRWSVFVANRVGEIQRTTDIRTWRHVPSPNNPTDILSRGIGSRKLALASMWWHGPPFLGMNEDQWPNGKFQQLDDDVPEQIRVVATVVTQTECVINNLLEKYSYLKKICRIIAYCLRFSKIYRPKVPTEYPSPAEKLIALKVACRVVQARAFPSEYKILSQGSSINASSNILSLAPFMDEVGLIRVGGRLKNSDLQYDACHPILLPRHYKLTRRIIKLEHDINMHPGAQATMAFVRQRFWPLSLRSTTRNIIQKCITCFKAKPRFSEATMGSLPAGRVTVSRPFCHCGVDYAGPVGTREERRRNARNSKAYVAIFVCFATKGVHIEIVSDLTSEAFIAAFKRFISRRGKPSHMYSDNGTTFVGARNQLKELYDFYRGRQAQADISRFMSEQEISWNFIPPNAPHFGGLWEAAVKSAKLHMARIVGQAHLTYEELQTRVEQLRQHFWRRWSHEYLHSLQERTKWKCDKGTQLMPNQVVLIKQSNLPPLQWAIGRVQEVHPGSDKVARTATIKTAKGVFVRPLPRLAILPLESERRL
ncbi:uncharacterized protein LOC105199694 [Solenopsis invicta]|uniref:uncharacterized protein LOC105199694 n=1 Tax=Solenopsis invicta TaxID=13686 RepID=UPI00193CA5CA|nr:uncharacterized protein LOC105199694 [Solenopsis invicta]